MTQEAIQLDVFRHRGTLFVVPGALSGNGFRALDELITVEDSDLVRALERGERSARTATGLPRDKRFETGTAFWKQAGCPTFPEFVKGTTSVTIVRDDELTELFFSAPSPDGLGLDSHDDPEQLGAGTPLNVVAEHVLAMFAKH